MLREIFTWLRTPCPPAARRLGHLAAAIGLESRARRCRAAWAAHIEHCHAAVRQSLSHCGQHRTALVLGSGLALEYPLAELSARFARVILADIVHLPALRRQAKRYPNVELAYCDLTGLAAALVELPRGSGAAAIEALPTASRLPAVDDVDWVVSCNLLSQLPLLPVAWLAHRSPQVDTDTLEQWGRRLMRRHLDDLAACGGERCLIADAEQTTRDRHGRLLERADIGKVLDLERRAYASWSWPVAPPGELADGLTAEHRVVACRW